MTTQTDEETTFTEPDWKQVRSCETDMPKAKLPHMHIWSDDTNSYSKCTETYVYQQEVQKAIMEAQNDW